MVLVIGKQREKNMKRKEVSSGIRFTVWVAIGVLIGHLIMYLIFGSPH